MEMYVETEDPSGSRQIDLLPPELLIFKALEYYNGTKLKQCLGETRATVGSVSRSLSWAALCSLVHLSGRIPWISGARLLRGRENAIALPFAGCRLHRDCMSQNMA